jgi:hypothetical protein
MSSASPEDGFEELLNELTGSGPIDDDFDDDAEVDTKTEAEPEPEAEPESEPAETEDVAEVEEEDDEEDPGNLRLETSESEEPAKESEPSTEERLAAGVKREAGLSAELRKLRAERRQNALQASRQDAPVPTREFVPTPPTVPTPDEGRIPVVVSEDGQSVYVDDAALQTRAAEIARREFAEASKPTPDQIRAHSTQQLAQQFIGVDPESQSRRQEIFVAAQKADDYISMKLTAEANRQGVRFENSEQAKYFMHQTGIAEEAAAFFPDIAPMLDEFVDAYASDNSAWKRSVLNRIAKTSAPHPATNGASAQIEKVSGGPQSLTRKGGTRSVSSSSDEAEFEKLESAFRKDPIGISDKQYDRYQSLGKKLEKEGMDV